MFVSAEIRWFWKDTLPDGIDSWFRSGPYQPQAEAPRIDEYLVDHAQTELGIKRRGSKTGVEVKGLVALARREPAPFEARTQIWTKWSSHALTIEQLACVSVGKTRWLRKFDTSGADVTEVDLGSSQGSADAQRRSLPVGCQLELSSLALGKGQAAWWSIGFEAFGELETVERSLHRTLAHLTPAAPTMRAGLALGYPEWLARFAT